MVLAKKRQRGGRVSMPIEFFGGNSGRYFPAGSSELRSVDSAYGLTSSAGHGVSLDGRTDVVGPDLAPGHGSIEHSGIQTGGGRRRRRSKSRSKSRRGRRTAKKSVRRGRKASKKSRRNRRNKRGGNLINSVLSQAGRLAVPVGLVAGRELFKKLRKRK
jgi:hypothetical protein